MDKNDIFSLLEEKMIRYAELIEVPAIESGEEMLDLAHVSSLPCRAIDPDSYVYSGPYIYVRISIAERLKAAAAMLEKLAPGHQLEVYYGYRSLERQTQLFEKQKQQLQLWYGPDEEAALLEAIHRIVAVPEVAGHPTGGAIDARILDPDGQPLEMGTPPRDFRKDSYTFSPFISKEAWHNRQLLRRILTANGFAPFDGEWWHFSYGDREWARYYNETHAMYRQIHVGPVFQNGQNEESCKAELEQQFSDYISKHTSSARK